MPRSRLVVEKGPDAGKEWRLDRTSYCAGTSPVNDLVLTDETISQRHFELEITAHGYLLKDLGSTNGTHVDGYRVGQIYLTRNARIEAGETRLRFAVQRGEVEIPLSRATNFGELLGHSTSMRMAFAILDRAARTDSTVLIRGESGTGKELAARALHERSERRDGPYMLFDCGAATPSLLQSELFGHVRGAFTGAVETRAGVVEAAHGGTLVLDEIGELPLDLQPQLLRVLENRTVQRVGETKVRPVDVRFIACTNRNLDHEVAVGQFREDLFFRLSVIAVTLPPLRERKEEVPRLLRHFVSKLSRDDLLEIPKELEHVLLGYDWPGNVRELRNFVERFLTLPDADPETLLQRATSPAGGTGHLTEAPMDLPFHEAKRRWTEQFERAYISRLYEAHEGNISALSRATGLSRQSCYRLIEKYGLRVE